ncbi:MAG TPA: hypothetical protein DEF47_10535 [Herpetosiphon sp.]|uniref:Band 7 protein n=1 Tax=Herpetosiphon aurantiacus (strain ATCC 23779 / DSM 785 / 114-95) TaxID=316274 RepID=A9AYP5_HERA2|nr:hypothetical protein [Herpetosiphon sp.]ABX05023.1 conserved hypothetical protein [Herpetosiphon aurantiacus DSM 785]HBW50331.1 hypothetical protein [Herpetosiphon sp.]
MSSLEQHVDTLFEDGAALLNGNPSQKLGQQLTFNGLATPPQLIARRFLGKLVDVLVPPAFTAILSGPQGLRRCLTSGSYNLWDIPRGPVMVQWVSMSRMRREIGPIEGWSADKWRVRFTVVVDFEVCDPYLIASHQAPLTVLEDVVRSAAMQQFERMSHEALTGYDPEIGGIDRPALRMFEQLSQEPALAGLTLIRLQILDRAGDLRRIEAATETAVAIAQLEESTRLQRAEDQAALLTIDGQVLRQSAEAALRMAATIDEGREQLARHDIAAQRHALNAQLHVLEANMRAQVAEIAREEQAWQHEQQRLMLEWQSQIQAQQSEQTHDQQYQMLDLQHRFEALHAERAHEVEERRHQRERELRAMQQRHEQVLINQRERLEHWRSQHERSLQLTQQQHQEQLALIQGTTTIASQAAGYLAQFGMPSRRIGSNDLAHDPTLIAGEGLRSLRMLQEQLQPQITEPAAPSEASDASH